MSKSRALSYEVIDALMASDVSACALRVALCIGRYQGGNEWAWPSMTTIRVAVGANERTVQRAIKDLASAGLVEVNYVPGRATQYRLATPGVLTTPTPGENATPGKNAAPGENATPTPGVLTTPPPAFSPGTPGVSIHSHLSLQSDHEYRSLNTVPSESVGPVKALPGDPTLTSAESTMPLGRVLGGFRERWTRKTASTWRAPSKHIDRAAEVAADFADKPEQLTAALDAFFETDDPFVLKSRWAFGAWLNDPRRWLDGTPSIGRVKPATHRADVATQITDDLFVRKEAARV